MTGRLLSNSPASAAFAALIIFSLSGCQRAICMRFLSTARSLWTQQRTRWVSSRTVWYIISYTWSGSSSFHVYCAILRNTSRRNFVTCVVSIPIPPISFTFLMLLYHIDTIAFSYENRTAFPFEVSSFCLLHATANTVL